ncbi:RHS repeat-associated core domain-containing protein [Viridibacillus arvi]|uniref:RHS repeat-associated core domain-containing protein n=1 Tax=Viridibacillus arvi TaxID=263475 RepID=UPI003D06178F
MKLYAPKNVKIIANEDNLVQNKTSLTFDWKASTGARYYEIQLNDGETTKKLKVKGNTTYTTKKASYDLNKKYTATVTAFFEDDDTAPETEEDKITGQRGLSDTSSAATVQPNSHEELIGLEDYFTYDESEFGNASSSVNVTTGNMALQFKEESLNTRSDLGYDFIRTYNSRSTKSSALGKGWTFVGNETLKETSNGDVLYEDEDGTVHTFKKEGDTFTSPKGLYEQLKKENDVYTMTDKNGFVQTFKVSPTAGTYVIASYADSYKNQIDFKRNDKGQVTEVAETKGTSNQENILISYSNYKISKVQYGDHWTTYEYTDDQLTKTTIGSEKSDRTITETFAYDTNGQLIQYTDGKENETTFKYNENELIVFDKQAADEELSVTNTYKFNQKENEYIVTDSSDNETVYKRDEKNNTFAVVHEDAPGEDEQNTKTLYTYDEQYNVTEIINADGTRKTNTYDKKGNPLTSTTKDGTTANTYNDQNQLVKSVATNGEETVNTYDGPSLISSTVKDEETKYAYDSYGHVTKMLYANNTFEKIDYDDEAGQVTSTDKKGNTTSITYSIYGQKVKEVDADGHKKSYTYDPMYPETLTSITDGNGHKTEYQYDKNNNLTTLKDALDRKKTYTYNDNDQVTTVTMPNMKFQYQYDQNGELSQSKLPSGITTNYTYNSDGQVSQVENGNETVAYQYDENGNTTSISRNGTALKTFEYTKETNLLANYTMGLFSQKYSYDDQERLAKRTTVYDQGLSISQNTSYKENSDDIDHIQYGVGEEVLHDYQSNVNVTDNQSTLILNDGLLKQVAQMNDANLLSSLTYTSKGQQPFNITYEYTRNGNISKETANGQVSSFEYDANDQLTKETLPDGTVNSYAYDAVGNRTKSNVNGQEETFTYNDDDANQIEKKNDTAYKYDADGNLLQDENYQYTYNEQQRLTNVQTVDGKAISSYTYDENGLRLTKTVGDTMHEYFYNNKVLDMEVVKVNNEIIEYRSYEWRGYTPLGMIVKAKNDAGNFEKNTYQFITNQRGDVLSIRNSEDKEVGSYQYDAYGNILAVEGTVAKENPIRYAGYYYDTETKNYYLQARYYNPDNGAFLALDSHPGDSDEPLSQNGYTYGSNNPMKYVDPFGKFSMRTEAIKRIIDGAMSLIPAGRAVQLLLRSRNHSQITRRMGTASIRVVTDTTDTALYRMGVNKKARRAIIASMTNTFAVAIDFTVGGMVVRIMKRYFKTYDKKAKAYGWWGPKVSYEYMKLW